MIGVGGVAVGFWVFGPISPVFGVHANESGGTPCVRLVMIEIVDPSQICHGVNGAITGIGCTTNVTVSLVVHVPVVPVTMKVVVVAGDTFWFGAEGFEKLYAGFAVQL